MTEAVAKKNNWISMTVRLSRKTYFPGAVVSGVLTIEPSTEESLEEYISFITIQVMVPYYLFILQLHGYVGVSSNLAILPKEITKDKKHVSTMAYGNVSKFINDNTDCIYQTNPILLDSDITLTSKKACNI